MYIPVNLTGKFDVWSILVHTFYGSKKVMWKFLTRKVLVKLVSKILYYAPRMLKSPFWRLNATFSKIWIRGLKSKFQTSNLLDFMRLEFYLAYLLKSKNQLSNRSCSFYHDFDKPAFTTRVWRALMLWNEKDTYFILGPNQFYTDLAYYLLIWYFKRVLFLASKLYTPSTPNIDLIQ